LIGVDVELLRKLSQGSIAFDGRKRHLRGGLLETVAELDPRGLAEQKIENSFWITLLEIAVRPRKLIPR
jgi:hypothetical protein